VESKTYAVRILDMFHYQDPEHELLIDGFPSLALAIEYARRRVWDSVEECRGPDCSKDELRRRWVTFGEDAIVVGGNYAGSHEIEFFVDNPATPEQRDWPAIARISGVGS